MTSLARFEEFAFKCPVLAPKFALTDNAHIYCSTRLTRQYSFSAVFHVLKTRVAVGLLQICVPNPEKTTLTCDAVYSPTYLRPARSLDAA